MNKTKNLQIFAIFSAVTLSIAPLSAQNLPNSASSSETTPLAPLYACAAKTDPMERLNCYDSAVGAIKAKEAAREIVTIDAPKVQQMRREAFGFNLPSLPKLGLPKLDRDKAANSDIERQTMQLERIGRSGGVSTFVMTNGQVWANLENVEIDLPRNPPFNATIRTAALGSFILSIDGRNRGYRVRRIQ